MRSMGSFKDPEALYKQFQIKLGSQTDNPSAKRSPQQESQKWK